MIRLYWKRLNGIDGYMTFTTEAAAFRMAGSFRASVFWIISGPGVLASGTNR